MVAFKSFNATPNLLHPPDTVGTEARRTLQVRRCQLGGPAAYAHDVTAGIHECYPASGTSLRRRRYMETEEERVASVREGGPLLPARLSISGMAFTSHGFFIGKCSIYLWHGVPIILSVSGRTRPAAGVPSLTIHDSYLHLCWQCRSTFSGPSRRSTEASPAAWLPPCE